MKKIILTLSLFLFTLSFVHAQILFQEDFESGVLPAGWIVESNASDGGWNVGTPASLSSNAFSIPSNGSTNIVGTNDDDCNCNKSNEYLITPSIDLSAQTVVALKFDAFYNDNVYQNDQEDATIEVSLDGGITWEVMEDLHGHGSWDTHGISLNDYAGEESVTIGFRYDDGSGWLYGFAIDNVIVEVPPALEAELVELGSPSFGEIGTGIPIKGTVFNGGGNTITSLEISYSVNGGSGVSELLDNLTIQAFEYYNFELANLWQPTAADTYSVEVSITAVNGTQDSNQDNNSDIFETDIFDEVIVPNKIDEILASIPVITEITGASSFLNKPTDLDFFPILGKDELWVVNQRTESQGGSTVTIADAVAGPTDFDHRVDGNAWHFMSLPTAIAFSDDNFNFATSPGVQDANHNNGTFTGPTLWSSDPDIYAQPSGGNGSHLDMLHGSPYSMGIAHEVDNVFWVYDYWNNDIVRYDFVDDHGPGNDDHSDAIVRRYQDLGIVSDDGIPNHMILDKSTGWLYFVDNGNDRVVRLDINTGSVFNSLPPINEPLAEHSAMGGFTYEVIIENGLDQPCGIEIIENRLLVGDYSNGDIIVYDMDNDFVELGRIPTEQVGLTGIKIGPDGNIWYTNRLQNTLSSVEPGDVSSTSEADSQIRVNISPNPTTGLIHINIPKLENNAGVSIRLSNATGQTLRTVDLVGKTQELDLSELSNGLYLVQIQGEAFSITKKIILTH